MQNGNGNSGKAIVTQEQIAIEEVKRLANIVRGLRNDVFKQDLDFGIIPGTGTKPVLLLPGMEKLMRALHLRAEYVEKSRIEDFDAGRIYYRYECRLMDYETGICVSTAIGSANSYESKWRWREQRRKCPVCGKEAIIKGKQEYGGGWLCFKKQEGCGAKFPDGDQSIEEQVVGRIENPDIFDQMNTIDKIAQKRALASAIKGAANVSEFFTVDLEDFAPFTVSAGRGDVIEGTFTEITEAAKSPAQPSASVRGAGLPVQKPQAQQPPSADELPPFGIESEEPAVRPNETELDPNIYLCDKLAIGGSRTSKSYTLFTQSGTSIEPLNLDVLAELTLNDTPVAALKMGVYPLSPAWSVQADNQADGWHVARIETGIPV